MALQVRSPFDTILTFALDFNMLTLSIDSLSNLVDTHIIDTVITGDSIDNATVSSISTSRNETTTMQSLTETPNSAYLRELSLRNTLSTTNRSPALTVEGAPLVAFDNDTVVSVPEGSSRRRMNGVHENSDNGYDSDGNIGPFFDAIAGESPSLDEALMDNDDPNSNISIPPDRSHNNTSTNNNEVAVDQPNNTNGR